MYNPIECQSNATCTNCSCRKGCFLRQSFYDESLYNSCLEKVCIQTIALSVKLLHLSLEVAIVKTAKLRNEMDERRKCELELHGTYSYE